MSKVLDHLLKAVRDAAVYNPNVEVKPACILWPDKERQWEAVIPRLLDELPELMILGDYAPEKRTGPAIWLRCVLAGRAEGISLPKDQPPIFYLPDVSRQALRAVENCQDYLKPLAELQYRGVIWSQVNAKDWTVLAYLKSEQGGLGLDIVQDNDTKKAMRRALVKFLDVDFAGLKEKRLDKDYFNNLSLDADPISIMLQWLNEGDAFRGRFGKEKWETFVEQCISQFRFNPDKEGVLDGATHLANHKGPWDTIWNRYCEAFGNYPNVRDQIKKSPPNFDLFANDSTVGGWPQWNEQREKSLRSSLNSLNEMPAHKAREIIEELEKQHGSRRNLVWAKMGDAPLAFTLEHLATIAENTKSGLAAGSMGDLAEGYRTYGWRVDDGVIRALAHVESSVDFDAVASAIQSIYLPWVEESARHLQEMVNNEQYPGGSCRSAKAVSYSSGDCILFVDGLRFDVGKRLVEALKERGFEVDEELAWAALPSVTATGKPAVTPVRDKIHGEDGGPDFEPSVAESGQSLKGGYHLKKLLKDNGWSVIEGSDVGDIQGLAWCEYGDIDSEGHHGGYKIATRIEGLILEIKERISELLEAGWKRVRVVTDHGWLLLPKGLPKIDLPSVLTDNEWGRCASLKPGARSEERLYPWYWNPEQYFALADGVSCFKKGEEYAHGGLSLQECLTLQLTVKQGNLNQAAGYVEFTDVVWKGLRCTVAVEGNFAGLSLDVRGQAGDPSSSLVLACKQLKDNGTASVVVPDENKEGSDATVVLIDVNGTLVKQIATVIGGENT